MKKLSKIVALLLAGAMAMVMLTACSGGGNTGSIFGYKFVLGGEVKGKDKEYLTVLVATNFSYEDTILGLILNEISKKVNTDTNVNINQNGAWTDIGVVVKGDSKHSYMAIAFKVKNPNYHK